MQILHRVFLAASLLAAPSLALADAYHDLAREPHGIEAPDPKPAPPAPPPSNKITIYTAKTIVTEDPGTPAAEAVAVMGGKILGVGTLDEVQGWVTTQEVEIDRRFQDAVIVPGFIEAHMHPQITGVLWLGVYVGRFDRTSPDGTRVKGLETKQAVLERLKEAAAKMPAGGNWLVAWGYQPEFYDNSPLTRADLDPISNDHPMLIENLSMHIYYANSKAFEIAGIGDDTTIIGIVKKDGKPTGEIEEITAALTFAEKLPPLDDKTLLKATWDAAALAHRVGVTTFADLSFGTIPGGYKAYQTAAADPNFPLRTVLNPVIQVFQKPEIVAKGGLDLLTEWHKADTDRLSFGGVKFVVDGSIQGYTGLFQWPNYYKTFANGIANISQDDLTKWVTEVHKRGFQAVIHTNADEATEMALAAVTEAEHQDPQLATASAGAQSICDAKPAAQDERAGHGHQSVHQPHLLLGRSALLDLRRAGSGRGYGPGGKRAATRHPLQHAFGRVGHAGRSSVLHVDGDGAEDHVWPRPGRGRTHHRAAGAARGDPRRRLSARAGRQEGLDQSRQARRFHRA